MQPSRKQLRDLDKPYLAVIPVILAISAVVQTTASFGINPDSPYIYAQRHLLMILSGVALFLVASVINYRDYRRFSIPLFLLMVVSLALVLVPGIGSVSYGARRWFLLGPLSIQPSEFAKLIFILLLADLLDRRKGTLDRFTGLLPAWGLLLIPVGMILLQPDLGTAMVFFAIAFFMLFAAGANPKILFSILAIGLGGAVLLLFLHFQIGLPLPLQEYQVMRLTVFLDPYNDGKGGLGPGYNIIQSLIAVGSGGLVGRGFLQGTQSQANFLPFHHTDFVFAVIGEEFGFIGSILVLACFFFLMYRALAIAGRSQDLYGSLIAAGVVGMLFFHVTVSAGMAMGVMPITGLPFPILSSGGSNMWTNMAALGLLVSIDYRKKTIMF